VTSGTAGAANEGGASGNASSGNVFNCNGGQAPGGGGGICTNNTLGASGADGEVIVTTTYNSTGNTTTTYPAAGIYNFVSTFVAGTITYVTNLPGFAIGTTTPTADFTIQSASSTPAMDIWSSIGNKDFLSEEIDNVGHLKTGGITPTCGSGCNSVTGDDRTMLVNVTGSSAVVNFANAWMTTTTEVPITPICIANEESGGVVATNASSTPTAVTLEFASSLTSKLIGVQCQTSNNFTF